MQTIDEQIQTLAPTNPDYYKERSRLLKLTDYPVYFFDIDYSDRNARMIRWHYHDEVEFIYVASGDIYVTCETSNFKASKGDIIFINQKIKHFVTPVIPKNTRIQDIVVAPNFISGMGHLELEQRYVMPVIYESTFKYLHITPNDPLYDTMHSAYMSAIEQNTLKDTCYELTTKSYIIFMWKVVYDKMLESSSNLANPRLASQDEQRIKLATEYIYEHYTENITLENISSHLNISKSECCRCFNRCLGMSPFDFIIRYRINESVKRMRFQKHESISDIAASVGFNNTSYYNKLFKREMGCTPSQYRKNLNKDIPNL